MAKIVKKKKKKNRISLERKAIILFTSSLLAFVVNGLFLKAFNTSLVISIQSQERQIQEIENENKALRTQIQTLKSRDRITTIAKEAGLKPADEKDVKNIIKADTNINKQE